MPNQQCQSTEGKPWYWHQTASVKTKLKLINRPKIGCILYDNGGKPGTRYPDLEPGNEF